MTSTRGSLKDSTWTESKKTPRGKKLHCLLVGWATPGNQKAKVERAVAKNPKEVHTKATEADTDDSFPEDMFPINPFQKVAELFGVRVSLSEMKSTYVIPNLKFNPSPHSKLSMRDHAKIPLTPTPFSFALAICMRYR